MVAVLRGDPVLAQLLSLGPCEEAVNWLRGQPLDEVAWKSTRTDWRRWLVERLALAADATFAAVKKALTDGDGSGDGSGYGSGYGDGSPDALRKAEGEP